MANSRSAVIAVLTGDLVGSSGLSVERLAQVRDRLAEAAARCASWRPGLVIGGPQFFRGDSWQLALSDPGLFLRVAIALRASLLSMQFRVDSRIAVGIGGFDRIDDSQISLSVGDAFTRSGNVLDLMKRDTGFRVEMPPALSDRFDWMPAMLALCGELVGRFQPRQAELVWRSLAPSAPLQKDVAADLGITPQSVSEGLASSGFSALVEAMEALERADWQFRPRVRLV